MYFFLSLRLKNNLLQSNQKSKNAITKKETILIE